MIALEHPALSAPDPATWLSEHLAARFAPAEGSVPHAETELVSGAELLAEEATRLRRAHDGITSEGTPGQAASHYLADWFAGAVAGAVGFGLAAGGCGFIVDAGELRWRLHPGGWPDAVELGRVSETLVLRAHPWAGRADVTVVPTAAELIDRSIAAMVDAVTGLLDACRSLARVGRPGMWNEVGDGIGRLFTHQGIVEVTPAVVEVLEAAVRAEAAPWKARPSFRFAASRGGLHLVVQKGGCCLAYTRTDWPEPMDEELDEPSRAFRAAFPNPERSEPWYCSTCSFRSAEDCDARVVLWHELAHPEP